jgi:hypothetical protein
MQIRENVFSMFSSLTLLFNVTLSTQTVRRQHQFHTLNPHKRMTNEHITPIGTTTKKQKGRAIAQAVSHRLPTAAARVQTRVWSCGSL